MPSMRDGYNELFPKRDRNSTSPWGLNHQQRRERERDLHPPEEDSLVLRLIEIKDNDKMLDCRPLAFLIGLPFALVAMVLSLVAAIVWILGSVLSCLCPCCICCTAIVNLAMEIVELPVRVIRCFIEKIPC